MSARLISLFIAIACCAAPALAHAFLRHADPGAGATLRTPPKRIALNFSEKLEAVFSGAIVTDAYGRNVQAGAAVIAGNSILVPLRSLAAGNYRVSWHVVSVDTHRTEGAYSFAVKP
jgi:methionine-rich copper-binding protein CopC